MLRLMQSIVEARLDELYAFMKRVYRVDDPVAIDVLLACRVESTIPKPTLLLEADCFTRDFGGCWFAFGSPPWPQSLAYLRTQRARDLHAKFDNREFRRGVFIEPEYETPLRTHRGCIYEEWDVFYQDALSLRVAYPKTGEGDTRELKRLVDRALDKSVRDWTTIQKGLGPFTYWAELLTHIVPRLRSWDDVRRNMLAVIARLSNIQEKMEVQSHLKRLLQDSVPVWIAALLTYLHEQPASYATLKKLNLIPINPNLHLPRLLTHLSSHGVIAYAQGKWRLKEENAIKLINGDINV